MSLHPTHIEGKITLSDGSETSFSIEPDLGWQQFGNNPSKLGETVDLMDAISSAAAEHGLAEASADDESEASET